MPVSADLEAGYGDAGETVRRAIGVGVVGANIEDEMRPFDEAVAAVAAVTAAAEAEGVPFALNARTDAFLRAGDRDREDVIADAIARGRAFLEAGATCVFVPGRLDEPTVERLVEGIGERKMSVIAVPGSPPLPVLERLGVARVSLGPWSLRIALTAWADAAAAILGGAVAAGGRASALGAWHRGDIARPAVCLEQHSSAMFRRLPGAWNFCPRCRKVTSTRQATSGTPP